MLINGIRLDHSYCQAHYEAIEAELNLDIVYLENVPMDCYSEIVSLMRDKGCKIIIGVSFEFGKNMMKAAAEYQIFIFFMRRA